MKISQHNAKFTQALNVSIHELSSFYLQEEVFVSKHMKFK